MEYSFTQGVSGWRAIFDSTPLLPQVALAAKSFVEFLNISSPVILVGMDTRPTGRVIAAAVVQSLLSNGAIVRFAGVVAAPEIMAASHSLDGFIFVTASHNPVEYNGLKFGRKGAVLNSNENNKLSSIYCAKCDAPNALSDAQKCLSLYHREDAELVYRAQEATKRKAIEVYQSFVEKIIGNVSFAEEGFAVLADFNGGARALSIDKDFFAKKGVGFYAINDGTLSSSDSSGGGKSNNAVNTPLAPVHGIVPEGKNLVPLAQEMERLHTSRKNDVAAPYGVLTSPQPPVLGYMTDCDGDRGNIVYWDEEVKKAVILQAQEVFALAAMHYLKQDTSAKKAVAVNCATSRRIDDLAVMCHAKVCRSEVGEANVQTAADDARKDGYSVPIAGEGSNGGLITYPSRVRDPIMTVFALLSLMREYGSIKVALQSIPQYVTTGATEDRAQLHCAVNKTKLKEVFLREWNAKKDSIVSKYGFVSYDVALTNGGHERVLKLGGADDWDNGSGGLKIRLFDAKALQTAFLWLRKSGTENLLRIMCDVKGSNKAEEAELLEWWRQMITEASK